jgi:hypothetical protein
MPKSRGRGKRNSNLARDHKLFSTCHLFTWEGLISPKDGMQYTTAQCHLRMGGWCPMTEYLADQLTKRPRNWMIAVRALCRAADGVEWMESQMFDLPSTRISDISGAYHDLRAGVLSTQQTSQVYDMGWIAQTWAGTKPSDPNELWHYYYAPPGIIPRPAETMTLFGAWRARATARADKQPGSFRTKTTWNSGQGSWQREKHSDVARRCDRCKRLQR